MIKVYSYRQEAVRTASRSGVRQRGGELRWGRLDTVNPQTCYTAMQKQNAPRCY
jgi:hypothetical protein